MTLDPIWLSSLELRKILKISSCELMHRREVGLLRFKKVGSAYYYMLPDQIVGDLTTASKGDLDENSNAN